MKKTDIAALILIASISLIIAWFVGNAVIGEPKQKNAKVVTAEKIDATVAEPNKIIFNAESINPRVDRSIGGSSKKLPLTQE